MTRNNRFVLSIALATVVCVGLVWALLARGKKSSDEETERQTAAPTHVTTQGGFVVVTMKSDEQERNGIRTAQLEATSRRQELAGTAVILTVHDLINLRNEYVSASAQLQKAKASLDVSEREYERINGLYKDDRNASAKAVQAAQGAMQSDRVSVKAEEDAVFLQQSNVRQQWGETVAGWLISGSSEFERIIRQQDLLLQITMPVGTSQSTAPASASLQTAQGKLLRARLVSPFPRLDSRIQSPSFLYITANQPGLTPGLNLGVLLPSGPTVLGVIVPADSVVWWEGKAWAYLQLSPDQFSRREVPTLAPTSGGWFVQSTPKGAFKPGDKLVINGAQQVLSEEFRSQTQTVGEKD